MTDLDHNIWNLVTNVITTELDKGAKEEDIIILINKITHGIIDQFDILREIARQRRSEIN
jgi:hypothetical protein